MFIIDFAKKGNVVRFYLGDDLAYHGDDWDDRPYECNAGQVYDEYIKGYKDIAFPFDYLVLEPCDGELNSWYCKNDMKVQKVPCIIVISDDKIKNAAYIDDSFKTYIGMKDIQKFYFGQEMEM